MHRATKPVLLKWRLEVMCYDCSLERRYCLHCSGPFLWPFCVCTSFKRLSFQSFEAVELHISGRKFSVSVVCLYRPPSSRKNKLSNQLFLQELPEFFTQFAGSHSDLVLLGDFNFHYGDCADTQVNRLKTVLSDHSLTQLVDAPTHRCGHTLDWVGCSLLRRE